MKNNRHCTAIPDTLFEAELFGSLPGAYTGAKDKRHGAFQRADGGTLFLDEVGELTPSNQAKLLRALQPVASEGPCTRVIHPVGMKSETERLTLDVRIIAATNRNLQERVREGAFREDLLYRLGAVSIQLPPLRDNPADIEGIATRILDRINGHFQHSEPGYRRKSLAPDAIEALRRRKWPGNVRELEGVLKQVSVFSDEEQITASTIGVLAAETVQPRSKTTLLHRPPGGTIDLPTRLQRIEEEFVRDAFIETGNQKAAANLLGISQQQVSEVLKSDRIQQEIAAFTDHARTSEYVSDKS